MLKKRTKISQRKNKLTTYNTFKCGFNKCSCKHSNITSSQLNSTQLQHIVSFYRQGRKYVSAVSCLLSPVNCRTLYRVAGQHTSQASEWEDWWVGRSQGSTVQTTHNHWVSGRWSVTVLWSLILHCMHRLHQKLLCGAAGTGCSCFFPCWCWVLG